MQRGGLSQRLDSRIVSKIKTLAEAGVRRPRDMEIHLNEFLKNDLFVDEEMPEKNNRRFFPKRADIRAHINKVKLKNRYSKIDQANVSKLVKDWQLEDPAVKLYFRSYGDKNSFNVYDENANLIDELVLPQQRLLFVHQSPDQQRLLERYGNNVCLLDATYKTTKYSIPLFFIATKTNVDYQIIGSFAIQDETTNSILEGLQKLKEWNKNWNPKVMFVDYCEEEINALETLFPGKTFNKLITNFRFNLKPL